MREFTPKTARTVPKQAKNVFQGEIYNVYQWPQKLFDGSEATFEMVSRPDTVKIIAVKGDKIVIVRQRQPTLDWYYDFPSGRHDNPAENELAAAKRELREETGMVFKNWKLIDVKQPFIKIDWLVYTFLATDFVEQGPQELDAGEEIEVLEMSFDEVKKLSSRSEAIYMKNDAEFKKYQSLGELLAAPGIYQYK